MKIPRFVCFVNSPVGILTLCLGFMRLLMWDIKHFGGGLGCCGTLGGGKN